MEILVVGVSRRRTPLAVFELLQGSAFLADVQRRLRALPGVREIVRLVTCRRVEFTLGLDDSGPEGKAASPERVRRIFTAAARSVLRHAAPETQAAAGGLDAAVFRGAGEVAFRHLLRTAVGLNSPLAGEAQVLGQVRKAWAAAVDGRTTGPILQALYHRLFAAARRVRSRAALDAGSPGWGEALAGAILAQSTLTSDAPILLLGSGTLARSLTARLKSRGAAVEPVDAGSLPRRLGRGGILVTVSGRGRILSADHPAFETLRSSGRTLDIWDLGMPRNVDAALTGHPAVRLRTLTDLEAALQNPGKADEARLERAAELAEQEVFAYRSWRFGRGEHPAFRRLERLVHRLDSDPRGAFGREKPEFFPEIPGRGRTGPGGFSRQQLLGAFASVIASAPDPEEGARRLDLIEQVLLRAIRAARPVRRIRPAANAGLVSLVGAGPGDPELLTLRGAARLKSADVVFHDALVSPETLALVRPGTRLIDVGKRRGTVRLPQEEIHTALIREARAGRSVVRLKGGDPFVFGRGGEEALALVLAGVPFEVVPGVSSGIAVPALAGIPLTHRGLSGSAVFATAHDLDGPGGAAVRRRLHHLARGADTLVLFMAGEELDRIARALRAAGLPVATPAALIESGSLQEQRVRKATLGNLQRLAIGRASGPALLVIGRTVALADELSLNARGRSGAQREILSPSNRQAIGRIERKVG